MILQILGSVATYPSAELFASSQFLTIGQSSLLIDCAEGTQIQLQRLGVKFLKLDAIFISHLHGDHYLGLMGLLSTMHLLGRKQPITIISPKGLADIINIQLKHSQTELNYSVTFKEVEIDTKTLVFENKYFEAWAFPLKHRIPCIGFLFKEKKQRMLNLKALAIHKVPLQKYKSIKLGEDYVTPDGTTISNEILTFEPPQSKTYAYCSDTIFDESIVSYIKNVDLLYHEATFSESFVSRAIETFHSTAQQAATIALKSNVKQLLLGHFSHRYKDKEILMTEAKQIFENVQLASDGKAYNV